MTARFFRLLGPCAVLLMTAHSGFATIGTLCSSTGHLCGTVTAVHTGYVTVQTGNPHGHVPVYFTSGEVTPSSTSVIVDDVIETDGAWSGSNWDATAVRRLVFGLGSGTQEYYVSTSGTNASGCGTSASPCADIMYMCDTIIAGAYTNGIVTSNTVIHVGSGTYVAPSNSFNLSGFEGFDLGGCSGSSTARLRFSSDAPGQAILENNWGNATTQYEDTVIAPQQNYADFVGFELTGVYTAGAIHVQATNSNGAAGISVNLLYNYAHDLATEYDGPYTGLENGCVSAAAMHGGPGTSGTVIGNVVLRFGYWQTGCDQQDGFYFSGGDGTGWIIENNILSNMVAYGIQLNAYSCNNTVNNNTVFHNGGSGIMVHGALETGCGEDVGGVWDGGMTSISNNIVVNNGVLETTCPACWGIREFNTGASTDVYENNLLYGNAGGAGDGIYTVAGSPTISGNQCENGVTHNCNVSFTGTTSSLFVNYQDDGSGDYHLTSGSAAINAGSSSTCPPSGGSTGCSSSGVTSGNNGGNVPVQDIDGWVRPQGGKAISIGAYEYPD